MAAAGSAEERIKLIDFGIARAQSEQVTRQTTQLAGSPGYIAPERWVGMESCASDIYSLAAIAWEMLTGESYQHGATHAPSTLPPAAAELLMAALSYDPSSARRMPKRWFGICARRGSPPASGSSISGGSGSHFERGGRLVSIDDSDSYLLAPGLLGGHLDAERFVRRLFRIDFRTVVDLHLVIIEICPLSRPGHGPAPGQRLGLGGYDLRAGSLLRFGSGGLRLPGFGLLQLIAAIVFGGDHDIEDIAELRLPGRRKGPPARQSHQWSSGWLPNRCR